MRTLTASAKSYKREPHFGGLMYSQTRALKQLLWVSVILLFLSLSINSHAQNTVHHKIDLNLSPSLKMLKAEVTLTFPADAPRKQSFVLNKNLQVLRVSNGDRLTLLHAGTKQDLFSEWGLTLGKDDQKVTLEYSGVVFDPVVNEDTTGFVSADGAVLMGSTYWYPFFLNQLKTFQIKASLPHQWKVVTQGQLTSVAYEQSLTTYEYSEQKPQEEIYFIAGPFFEYTKTNSLGQTFRVLLREDNKGLAQNYLSLIPDYVAHYSKLIGPYPYQQFAVVENFWETGYGMPGFTLLGPKVMRLPFILTSSLPHEILHNWWGNSVYVDLAKGNWAEGLTTYLADHWQQELTKADVDYRLSQLIAYNDYVVNGKDFPLSEFKGRHDSASQAVGYSKAMMFFHMLKQLLGPQAFEAGIQQFYFDNAFKPASYDDLKKSFETTSKKDLTVFFDQWLTRKGAPEIKLAGVQTYLWPDGAFVVSFSINQEQTELYDLEIPVRWTLENGAKIWQKVRLQDKTQTFTFTHTNRPILLEVDPNYDLFRILFKEERPTTLSQIFASNEVTVLYTEEQRNLLAIPNFWEQNFSKRYTYVELSESLQLPASGQVIMLGSSLAFEDFIKSQMRGLDFSINSKKIRILGTEYDRSNSSSLITARNRHNPGQTILWIDQSALKDLSTWARRLTHYGKFGALVFEGERNSLKSSYPSMTSPLKKELRVSP